MPMYDFKCRDSACGKVTEKLTKSNITQIECTCGALMDRQIGGDAYFVFKGHGTYKEKSQPDWNKNK